MEKFLEIKYLKIKYKTLDEEKTVLDIEHLEIEKGTTFGLVGESGAGKTVLAQTILGLLPTPPGVIESGEIWMDGENLLTKSMKEMETLRGSKMAMIFQDPLSCLNPVFTVKQQMMNVVNAHKKVSKAEAEKLISDMVRKVKLPDPERTVEKYPHELSGGQRQRIIIAMALLCGAEFLIADEPTGSVKLVQHYPKEIPVILFSLSMRISEIADRHSVRFSSRVSDS